MVFEAKIQVKSFQLNWAPVNEELTALVRSHLPHLSYQQVASPDFDLSSNNLEEAVRAKIEDKRRQVGKLKY